MPLDAGAFAEVEPIRAIVSPRRPRIVLDPAIGIGAALRGARVSLGLTLEQVAESTRVRARHLAALESEALDELPSRPFTIGYVRAYARALGADADATAARFRTEHPSPDDNLKSPLGVPRARSRLNPLALGLAGVIAVSIVGWNIAQHVVAAPAKHAQAPVATAPANAVTGPFTVDAPLPAPPEATAPAPYVTPVVGADAPANAVGAGPEQKANAPEAAGRFTPAGAIYGPTTGSSDLVIQARKSISLEVRGPGGVVYFARQLAAGEAYRVPALPNLTAEVSNPQSAELFQGGVSKGLLTQPQMALGAQG